MHKSITLLLFTGSALAGTITGTVTNATTHKPAANETVALIQLRAGMQEIVTTKTDARGHYSLNSPDEAMHLVKVTHDGAPYFSPAPPATPTVDVTVYDAAAKVTGIGIEANVLRVESSSGELHVIESYFVKNESKPQRTEFSEKGFEIVLPAGATLVGAAAEGPAGMPVSSPPIPTGEPNHYAFKFPIRPNETDQSGESRGTRFQVSYTLPYSGSLKFSPHPLLNADNIAVMMPKSMQFSGAAWQPVQEDMGGAQTLLVRGVKPGQDIAFTLSGEGQLPRDTSSDGGGQQQQAQPASAEASPEAGRGPGGGIGTPINTPTPITKYQWWILGGLALALAAVAGFTLRAPAQKTGGSVLDNLKEELFTLESEHLAGKISDADYAKQKEALETVLKRALSKQA